MPFIPETTDLACYLESTLLVDYHDPLIQKIIRKLTTSTLDETQKAKILFEYVRDQIPHTWDIQSPIVTQKALASPAAFVINV